MNDPTSYRQQQLQGERCEEFRKEQESSSTVVDTQYDADCSRSRTVVYKIRWNENLWEQNTFLHFHKISSNTDYDKSQHLMESIDISQDKNLLNTYYNNQHHARNISVSLAVLRVVQWAKVLIVTFFFFYRTTKTLATRQNSAMYSSGEQAITPTAVR